eukprot:4644658-Prymnesium_polylepis.1
MLKRYDALQRVRRSRSSSWPATPFPTPARGAAHVLFAEGARTPLLNHPPLSPSEVRSPHVHRVVDALIRSPMRSDCTTLDSTFFEANVYSSHTSDAQ